MKKSELLKEKIIALDREREQKREKIIINGDSSKSWDERHIEYWDKYGRNLDERKRKLEFEIMKEQNRELDLGDGATICLYSDRIAGTIVKKTKCSITIQHDKATLSNDFKPEIIPGGFSGHCINQDDQSYAYEKDGNGRLETFRWSEKYGRWQKDSIPVIPGRHQFYDYNF